MADIKITKNDQGQCAKCFFENILMNDNREEVLKNFAINGEVTEKLIRPTVWKLFLDVLPRDKPIVEWIEVISKNRLEYKKKLKTFCKVKKFSGDPLGGGSAKPSKKDPGWETYYEEVELKNKINLDLSRTYQDIDLFLTNSTKNTLANVLFIWSKENSDVSYQQGMNEILGVFYLAFYPFYLKSTQKPKPTKEDIISYLQSPQSMDSNINAIYAYFHDEEEIQADLFFVFESVMKRGIKDLFDQKTRLTKSSEGYKRYELFPEVWKDGSDEDVPTYVNRRSALLIKEKLKALDEELFTHFKQIKIDCNVALQRWFRCIFGREFDFKDVFVLWDAIFANENPKDKYPLIYEDYIAIAMIFRIRKDLILGDETECFTNLFKYPPVEKIVELIDLAEKVKTAINERMNGKNASVYDILVIPRPMMGSAYSQSAYGYIENKFSETHEEKHQETPATYNPLEQGQNQEEENNSGNFFGSALTSLGNFGGYIKDISNQVKEKVTEKIDQIANDNNLKIYNPFGNNEQENYQNDNNAENNGNYDNNYNNNYNNNNYNDGNNYSDNNNNNNYNYNNNNQENTYDNQEDGQPHLITQSGISDPHVIAPKLEEIHSKYGAYMTKDDRDYLKSIINFLNDNIN